MAESKKISFSQSDESSRVLVSWWQALEADRGQRAMLRRAKTPAEVALLPVFHRLYGRLRDAGYRIGVAESERLATIAGLGAHVKQHITGASLAVQMATPKSSGGGARVSGLRFRRLLAVSDRDELYPLLIRVVRLLGGAVNLVSLAKAAYWWNDKTKREWAYDYYSAAPKEA